MMLHQLPYHLRHSLILHLSSRFQQQRLVIMIPFRKPLFHKPSLYRRQLHFPGHHPNLSLLPPSPLSSSSFPPSLLHHHRQLRDGLVPEYILAPDLQPSPPSSRYHLQPNQRIST